MLDPQRVAPVRHSIPYAYNRGLQLPRQSNHAAHVGRIGRIRPQSESVEMLERVRAIHTWREEPYRWINVAKFGIDGNALCFKKPLEALNISAESGTSRCCVEQRIQRRDPPPPTQVNIKQTHNVYMRENHPLRVSPFEASFRFGDRQFRAPNERSECEDRKESPTSPGITQDSAAERVAGSGKCYAGSQKPMLVGSGSPGKIGIFSSMRTQFARTRRGTCARGRVCTSTKTEPQLDIRIWRRKFYQLSKKALISVTAATVSKGKALSASKQ